MIAKIKSKKLIAKDTLLVEFELPQAVEFFSGQSFKITLLNPAFHDSRGASRFFSIANSPSQKNLLTTCTRVGRTAFKKTLQVMPEGSEVDVSSIAGVFVLPPDPVAKFVLIAGGIGITPFISIIRHEQEQGFKRPIILIFSNPDQQSAAFLPELQKLAKDNPNFKLIATMTHDASWVGEKRRIDEEFLKKFLDHPLDFEYYIAGPPLMVGDIYESLITLGVKPAKIKTEEFTGY